MFNLNRHCEERQRRGNHLHILWIASLTFAITLIVSSSARAKDKEDTLDNIIAETALPEGAYRYSPDGCDFEVILPNRPHTSKRCADKNQNCTTLTSYTMVFDVTTTVEVSLTCVPSTAEQYNAYSEKVIRLALQGMTRSENMNEHQINTSEKDGTRQGSLIASTKRGLQNALYNAQLWVGQNSIMTLEARLVGPTHEKADQVFGDILSSVKQKAESK
jgi:hypothetical protein